MNDKNCIDYDKLMQRAMINIIKDVLYEIIKNGSNKRYCLIFEINTKEKGVVLPKNILMQYPQTITLIIQHQFSDLKVFDDYFSVNLSFGGEIHNVEIPFISILVFLDQENDFELRFDENINAVRGGVDNTFRDYEEEFLTDDNVEGSYIDNNILHDNNIIEFNNLKNKE